MKIDKIILTNFRQYYGENVIDLMTTKEKNIVLLGGKTGYGKTNFLLSLVWCLYGEDIAKIDEGFKKEIQKDGNYSKFLKSSLNWDIAREGKSKFSVEIYISGIELPETRESESGNNYKCKIKREFNINSSVDDFDITIEGIKNSMFHTPDDKINFINDYLIPLEAAKFVFFDAEKIASWAELSTKEEGSVLNDALGKLLGLDVYEGLINDLNIYTDGLRKESATAQVRQQIITTEKGIELNIEKIEDLETEIVNKESETAKIKSEIVKYETFLIQHSNKSFNTSSLDELYKQRNELKQKEKDLENKFNELSEIIPFVLAAGKLEEVNEHLKLQEEESYLSEKRNELIEKNNELIEKLFNNPPFPTDGDISFSKKMFYADKAKKIVDDVFGKIENANEFEFEHDLSKSDKELILETFNHIRKQSKDIFEQTIDNFNRVKNDIYEVEKVIKKIESDLEDEEVIEYTTNKNEAERKIEKLIEEKGSFQNQKENLKRENEKLNQSLQVLLKKISVSEQKKKKLDKANLYIKSLEEFVSEQKKGKCSSLEQTTFKEMQQLMHKLKDGSNGKFIAAIKAEALPNNDGLKISLFDGDGNITPKESLSMGEKQIYISSLVKAILSLAVQDFPIFIDTPLGRLDHEHINNFLVSYYPNLASQVVLMATNNEIPPSRFKLVKDYVANAYLLESNNNQTKFKQGYFQSYEN
jgi:DNA sulfur modification protein DndD